MITFLCGVLGIIFSLELYVLSELNLKELEAQEREWQKLFERTGILISRIDNLTAQTITAENLQVVDVDASRLSAAVVDMSSAAVEVRHICHRA